MRKVSGPASALVALALGACRSASATPSEAPSEAEAAAPSASVAVSAIAPPAALPFACPAGEVLIPPTPPEGFTMGAGFTKEGGPHRVGKGHQSNSDLPHSVVLTRAFCMDATEVTVEAYKRCVDEGACREPKWAEVRANYPKKLDHPVNEVSFVKAKAYCEHLGKSLPTEAQWEWAATGGDGRKWPWGDEEPTCEHADFTIGLLISPGGNSGCNGGGTSPVKTHPKGNKTWPGGDLYDLGGNVWEWCLDTYEPYPAGPVVDPCVVDMDKLVHVIRGGGWNRSVLGIRAAFRGAAVESYEVPGLGFRCVRTDI